MSKLNKFLVLFLLIVFTFISVRCSYATNINVNLAQEQNVTDDRNNDAVDTSNEVSDNSVENPPTLNTNTQATVQSVEGFEDNTGGFDITNILSIFLLAVGFVLILLAIAILIRLGK